MFGKLDLISRRHGQSDIAGAHGQRRRLLRIGVISTTEVQSSGGDRTATQGHGSTIGTTVSTVVSGRSDHGNSHGDSLSVLRVFLFHSHGELTAVGTGVGGVRGHSHAVVTSVNSQVSVSGKGITLSLVVGAIVQSVELTQSGPAQSNNGILQDLEGTASGGTIVNGISVKGGW